MITFDFMCVSVYVYIHVYVCMYLNESLGHAKIVLILSHYYDYDYIVNQLNNNDYSLSVPLPQCFSAKCFICICSFNLIHNSWVRYSNNNFYTSERKGVKYVSKVIQLKEWWMEDLNSTFIQGDMILSIKI